MMKLSEFDYHLPKELIAQHPLKRREDSRLLVLKRKERVIEHRFFKDLCGYLNQEDLLVLNDTKVVPCRLLGRRLSQGKAEVFLLKHKGNFLFEALFKPGRLRIGEKIIFNGAKIYGIVKGKNEISFKADSIDSIYKLGRMPLPPYIKREAEELDNEYYQTVYARHEGAVASPTAGLHFTRELIEDLEKSAVRVAYITLHVGLGTFKPVKALDIREHKMDKEEVLISAETLNLIRGAKRGNNRVFTVGTTGLRAIESVAGMVLNSQRPISHYRNFTDLFIYPGYEFKVADALITNFHLPKTTLYMLVCAFAGRELISRAYEEAIREKYRFYSYGDAMLII